MTRKADRAQEAFAEHHPLADLIKPTVNLAPYRHAWCKSYTDESRSLSTWPWRLRDAFFVTVSLITGWFAITGILATGLFLIVAAAHQPADLSAMPAPFFRLATTLSVLALIGSVLAQPSLLTDARPSRIALAGRMRQFEVLFWSRKAGVSLMLHDRPALASAIRAVRALRRVPTAVAAVLSISQSFSLWIIVFLLIGPSLFHPTMDTASVLLGCGIRAAAVLLIGLGMRRLWKRFFQPVAFEVPSALAKDPELQRALARLTRDGASLRAAHLPALDRYVRTADVVANSN